MKTVHVVIRASYSASDGREASPEIADQRETAGTGYTRTVLQFQIITLLFYLSHMWFVIIYPRSSVAVAWTKEHVYWHLLVALSFIYPRSGKWKAREI